MILVKENDVYIRQRKVEFTNEETITFKRFSKQELEVYEQKDYDWYMSVALEKSDKVTEDRHLLTADLLISYRYAIREGYNHCLDPHLIVNMMSLETEILFKESKITLIEFKSFPKCCKASVSGSGFSAFRSPQKKNSKHAKS